jgi:hypothetical protein
MILNFWIFHSIIITTKLVKIITISKVAQKNILKIWMKINSTNPT